MTPVSIVADLLERATARLDDLGEVDAELSEVVRLAAGLAAGLDCYTREMTTPESPALHELARRTAEHDWDSPDAGGLEQEMLSGHVEGQALKLLVHVTRARRVLEIGMFTGYSALAMSEALPDDGQVVACELDAGAAELAQECFAASPGGDRISVRVGPALETLGELADAGESFDLVFLDADKAGYVDYVSTLLDRGLLAPEALLCVDNTLMQGEPWLTGEASANGVAIAAFNRAVAEDPRVEQVLLPVRDGLTLIRQVSA